MGGLLSRVDLSQCLMFNLFLLKLPKGHTSHSSWPIIIKGAGKACARPTQASFSGGFLLVEAQWRKRLYCCETHLV